MRKWPKGGQMAKRKRLEAPGAEALAAMEAGFAAKPAADRIGLAAPIGQIVGEAARATLPLDAATRLTIARNSADAEAWRHALQEGRVISELPLEAIELDHLVRDRMVAEAAEMDELKTSIRAHGLRLPIEVIALPGGRYGLVSGWRRMTALQQLQAEDAAFRSVKAIIRAPYEAGAIYTAMVEENELRAQISPYERGRIAVIAAELGAFIDTEAAIETIFAAASRAKRSKIRSFALVHDELGDMLNYPTDLSERNGLRLAYALREGFGPQLRGVLIHSARSGPALEWALMEPIVIGAEAQERRVERGGRPRVPFAKPAGPAHALANGVTMERVQHADGYSIRLRGAVVDGAMTDLLMDQLRRLLTQL